jgi:hypothetical protein
MQKERFQEYLYKPENLESANLSELEGLIAEFPWFSTAAIILLNGSKIQGDPNFESLLKSLSIGIPNRKFIQRTVQNKPAIKTPDNFEKEETAVHEEMHSRIPGILDLAEESVDSENDDKFENAVLKSFEEDSLLDFAYSSKKDDSELMESETAIGITAEDQDLPSTGDHLSEGSDNSGQQNFERWLSKLGGDSKVEKSPYKKQEIIESFIHSDPGVIRADKETRLEGDVAKNSAEENEGFITDTLAKIYLKQGLYNKAIYAYEKLCLKYPEKSIYFVTQIEEIRSLYIKK